MVVQLSAALSRVDDSVLVSIRGVVSEIQAQLRVSYLKSTMSAPLTPVMNQIKDRKSKRDRENKPLDALRQEVAQRESCLGELRQDITKFTQDQHR